MSAVRAVQGDGMTSEKNFYISHWPHKPTIHCILPRIHSRWGSPYSVFRAAELGLCSCLVLGHNWWPYRTPSCPLPHLRLSVNTRWTVWLYFLIYIHPSGAKTWIFWANWVKTMATDVLALFSEKSQGISSHGFEKFTPPKDLKLTLLVLRLEYSGQSRSIQWWIIFREH